MSELARQLDLVVRAVPGVVTLFSVEPAIVSSVKELARATDSLVTVAGTADAPVITVSVGVDASAGAPTTASTIAAAIHAALPAGVVAEVVVRVSRVV